MVSDAISIRSIQPAKVQPISTVRPALNKFVMAVFIILHGYLSINHAINGPLQFVFKEIGANTDRYKILHRGWAKRFECDHCLKMSLV